LNVLAASPSNKDGDRAMNEKDDREQLERKLAQTRRLAAQASDLTTKGRLATWLTSWKTNYWNTN